MTVVIIPAKNEARTIGPVIRALRSSDYCDGVTVVDDCSVDDTALVAMNNGASVIDGPGLGKGQAMMTGVSLVNSSRVCFCDADLIGLRPYHADALLRPCDGEIIGLCDGQAIWAISGQRSLPRIVVNDLLMTGYGAETQINEAVSRARIPVYHVRLTGVQTRVKPDSPFRYLDIFRDRRR